jgi:hypothetical protein
MLRTKSEIEGMYEEIYKLNRENENLWRIREKADRWVPPKDLVVKAWCIWGAPRPLILEACVQSGSKYVAWSRSAMWAITWAVPGISKAIATEIANEGGRRGDEGMAQKYGCSREWDGW